MPVRLDDQTGVVARVGHESVLSRHEHLEVDREALVALVLRERLDPIDVIEMRDDHRVIGLARRHRSASMRRTGSCTDVPSKKRGFISAWSRTGFSNTNDR